jgi:predicted PurR-regulated permease PerM
LLFGALVRSRFNGDILLPFVSGIALAYVEAPLADRIERLGINRTVAALLIVTVVVLVLVALVLLVVPLLLQQGSALISHIPGYFDHIKQLIVDPNFPWLNWLASGDSEQTMSEIVSKAAAWLLDFAYSLWTGGKRWCRSRPS